MVGMVIGANDIDRRSRARRFDQIADRHAKRARNSKGYPEGRIGFAALDLAEHRTTHSRRAFQGFERPTTLHAKLLEPAGKMGCGVAGCRRSRRFGENAFFGGHSSVYYNGNVSCIMHNRLSTILYTNSI